MAKIDKNKAKIVLYKKNSEELKNAFLNLKRRKLDLYNIDFFDATEDYNNQLGEMECDVIFIGEDNFIIRATNDDRFYSRTSSNNPGTENNPSKQPDKLIYPWCTHGQYFDSAESAIETTISWLLLEPEELPRCYDPPITASEKGNL